MLTIFYADVFTVVPKLALSDIHVKCSFSLLYDHWCLTGDPAAGEEPEQRRERQERPESRATEIKLICFPDFLSKFCGFSFG